MTYVWAVVLKEENGRRDAVFSDNLGQFRVFLTAWQAENYLKDISVDAWFRKRCRVKRMRLGA